MKKKVFTKLRVTQLLKESMFDPNDNGPLQLILDEHIDDPDYLEKKAKELIDEARYSMRSQMHYELLVYNEKMQKAVFFMIAARIVRERIHSKDDY